MTMAKEADPKIIDLIHKVEESGSPRVSLEYFPPRTDNGVKNLYARMDRMLQTTQPLFTDVTWGAGGSTAGLSMKIAQYAQSTGHTSNLHMTCTNLGGGGDPIETIRNALQEAKDSGIRNIVALRGDPPEGSEEWTASEGGFTCALDLVKFIRKEFGNDFGIAVAGYPEGHPNAISDITDPSSLTESEKGRSSTLDGKTFACKDEDYKKEMDYLKQKVDAGADFIVTQMFFDVAVFEQFCKDCQTWGIDVPVVPGLMCINAYPGFKKMTKFCKTRIPTELGTKMEELKDDAAAIKQFGTEYGLQMCQALLQIPQVHVLHFYTLNLEKVVHGILQELNMLRGAAQVVGNDEDAKDMVAVGSRWARVGDLVDCIYGRGKVVEMRSGGVAVIKMENWILAGGQQPTAYLASGQYKKVF